MHPVAALERLGGAAPRGRLLRLTDRAELDRLVLSGDILREARGRYALPTAAQALRTANALTGVASHLSAAAHWGWEVKTQPVLPHVTFRRNRNVTAAQRRLVIPHWAELGPDDVRDEWVTSKARTLSNCLTALPWDEALAVADSALRHEDISQVGLVMLTAGMTGPGAARARAVAAEASAEAANPFESVLRAIALEVPGLSFRPQRTISAPGFWARPDLVDRERMLVLEADSHTWHSSREALRRDCRRYTGLTIRGWIVLRFAWEDVMFAADEVRETLVRLAALAAERARPPDSSAANRRLAA
ncbi:MAG: endonuclease domain-containing protein [Actinomycetota bacterium]|nr:endonuclease domain-containing protein [Actinomycetota bacterium]